MGAYFGYAVASGDIDGDGLDDLLVGAPMYTIPDNPEMTIETGRVYVIYQGVGPEKFRKVDSRYSLLSLLLHLQLAVYFLFDQTTFDITTITLKNF